MDKQKINKEKEEIKKEAKRTVEEFKKEVIDSSDENIIAAIGYIWILFLLPLLFKRESALCQHHSKQSLVLFVFSLIIMIISPVPFIGWVLGPLGGLLVLVLAVLGIVNALRGDMWEMPYFSKYAKKINF